MAIRSPQNRIVSYDDVFERFHRNQRTLCQRPLLGVIAHDDPYRWTPGFFKIYEYRFELLYPLEIESRCQLCCKPISVTSLFVSVVQ